MSGEKRKILYLSIEGLPKEKQPEVEPGDGVEVLTLTETNAAEALEKLFAADAVYIWGRVEP